MSNAYLHEAAIRHLRLEASDPSAQISLTNQHHSIDPFTRAFWANFEVRPTIGHARSGSIICLAKLKGNPQDVACATLSHVYLTSH